MTTAELKSLIHEKIDKIEDEELLESINEALQENLNKEIKLEQWEIEQIEKSESQAEQGMVISKEEADKKIEKWLKK